MPMIKHSTLFYIFDNLGEGIELYNEHDLTQEKKEEEEFDKLFDLLDYSPPANIIKKVIEKTS